MLCQSQSRFNVKKTLFSLFYWYRLSTLLHPHVLFLCCIVNRPTRGRSFQSIRQRSAENVEPHPTRNPWCGFALVKNWESLEYVFRTFTIYSKHILRYDYTSVWKKFSKKRKPKGASDTPLQNDHNFFLKLSSQRDQQTIFLVMLTIEHCCLFSETTAPIPWNAFNYGPLAINQMLHFFGQ
jgi:hypothetical protein